MKSSTDILIIGGGVAGLTAAAQLAPHASVTVIEAEDHLAYHASGRSAAMFLASYGNNTVRALNEASEPHHITTKVLSRRPILLVADDQNAEAFEAQRDSFGMDRIPASEARALWPILDVQKTPLTALRGDTSDLDTDLVVQTARKEARAHGAEIVTGTRVTVITRDHGWLVTTAKGTIRATTLVNAAGAWADEIAKLAGVNPVGLTPYRRSMARIPLPQGLDPTNWPFVDAAKESWYAKPDAGQLIVSPADEDPSAPMDAWADDMVIAEGLARFEAMTSMEVERLTATWAGLRTFAPDRTLVIGRDPVQLDFVWLAGQGGYGFQTAPAAARLCAAIVRGVSSELPPETVAALDPKRFAS